MNKLVIIEGPGKIKKVSSILGDGFTVKASCGHIRDLDKTSLSIDVNNNFKPNYVLSSDKSNIIKELRELCKTHKVIIATDNDREGEGICAGLIEVLNIHNYDRIVFTEITNNAIKKALENPRKMNQHLANAQEARRILDRLMGYLISPVLWKYLNKDAKSAGRVQSVVNKIIIDKEEEIKNAISTPYFKMIGIFNNLHSSLNNSTLNRHFDTDIQVKEFFQLITKKTIFKIVNITDKLSIRKPSAPYITSTLQQDASTKLKYNPKRTMEIAQKLYESGLITYMRTDSPQMSEEIKQECKEFIIEKFGLQYSDPKEYSSNGNVKTQDAHECIRPTHINTNIDDLKGEQLKLYNLIWERTVASQMSNMKVNIMTINIDAINTKSILIFDKQYYFVSTHETIEFDGFIKLTNDLKETKEEPKPEYKVDTILKMDKIKVSEEYTQLPLRFNEANLIKYLEKNGIGRPSTFASIITKVLERNYVEIKDIEGITKELKQIELSKTFKIKETIKETKIGSEKQKLVSTEIGININNFLTEHFSSIINIDFTAQMETHLDLIAMGKANYITIIRNFYDMFNPTVQKLIDVAKISKNTDGLLGTINGIDIFKGVGKFGPYIKILVNDKWKFISIKNNENITLENAYKLLSSTPKVFTVKNKNIYIKTGDYGPYLQIVSSGKKQNISIPSEYNIDTITIDIVLQIIANKNSVIRK